MRRQASTNKIANLVHRLVFLTDYISAYALPTQLWLIFISWGQQQGNMPHDWLGGTFQCYYCHLEHISMIKVTWQAWMRQCLYPGQICSQMQTRRDLCQRCMEGVTLKHDPL